MVRVTIDSRLRIELEDLPPRSRELIRSALTLPNEERERARKEFVYRWYELPETVDLWSETDTQLIIPRGFLDNLTKGLETFGEQVGLIDQRTAVAMDADYWSLTTRPWLRPSQEAAIGGLIDHDQGFFKAPPGAGKTIVMLELARRRGLRTLVIVDKVALAHQWIARADEHFDLNVGLIGDDIWNEADVTIALRQTLHSRWWELVSTGWTQRWGMVVLDEAHHLTADSLQQIAGDLPSQVLFGTSATPATSALKLRTVEAIVGPVRHHITRDELRAEGTLMPMMIGRVATDFEFDFHSSVEVGEFDACPVKSCKKQGRHGHRNNWSSLVKAVVEDPDRNRLIAHHIMRHQGHHVMVLSRQLKHLQLIGQAARDAGWTGPIHMLRGEENARGESAQIIQEIMESDEALLLTTIADEALDIPRIDRVMLTFPARSALRVEQQVGRGERTHPLKADSMAIDFVDVNVGLLMAQANSRAEALRNCGFPISWYEVVK